MAQTLEMLTAVDGTRHFRRFLFPILMLFAASSAFAQPANAPFTFDQHEIVSSSAARQAILTGFLFGGTMADIAVVDIDKHDACRLLIYTFDNKQWAQSINTTLRQNVVFVDVLNIGGHDRLITYEQGRLSWFDPALGTEHPLVSVTCNFDPPRENEIPHVDITHDLNGDGRDDLALPDADGFFIFTQMNDGTFADPVKIGPPTDFSAIYGAGGYRYDPWSQSRVHTIDYNHDGRDDLVFWKNDHFAVHLQNEHGLFAPTSTAFTTDVPFDSDVRVSLAAGNMAGRVLHSMSDLNDDGVADLVIFSLMGKKVSAKSSAFEVHFGAPSPEGGIAFAPEAGTTFQSDGRIQLEMMCQDFDGDGQIDVMFTTIERRFLEGSLWKELKGAMGDDVWLNLEFYRMKDGTWPAKPNADVRIALDGAPSHREPGWVPLDLVLRGAKHESRNTPNRWPRSFNPNLFIGDVTGDGHVDLLIENTFRGLQAYAGISGPNLFTAQHEDIAVILPNDEEYAWLVDLNRDGKRDILMHHPFTRRDVHGGRIEPPGTEPHRIVVLISR